MPSSGFRREPHKERLQLRDEYGSVGSAERRREGVREDKTQAGQDANRPGVEALEQSVCKVDIDRKEGKRAWRTGQSASRRRWEGNRAQTARQCRLCGAAARHPFPLPLRSGRPPYFSTRSLL